MGKYLTVPEASAILNIHPETCRKRIRSKKIKASKPFGGEWRISESHIENLLRKSSNIDEDELKWSDEQCQIPSHLFKEEKAKYGGTDLRHQEVESEYKSLLGLQ